MGLRTDKGISDYEEILNSNRPHNTSLHRLLSDRLCLAFTLLCDTEPARDASIPFGKRPKTLPVGDQGKLLVRQFEASHRKPLKGFEL